MKIIKDPLQRKQFYGDKDPFDPDERRMDSRNVDKIECQLINHPDAILLRNQMQRLFKDPLKSLEFETVPIALITFVISIFLAIDSNLRQGFCNFYQGKVPAITAFIFSVFRPSPISEKEYVGGRTETGEGVVAIEVP